MLLARTVGGERQQTGVIKSNDGKQAASSPDWVLGPDPKPMDRSPFSKADSRRWSSTAVKPDPSSGKASDAAAVSLNRGAFDRQTALLVRAAARSL